MIHCFGPIYRQRFSRPKVVSRNKIFYFPTASLKKKIWTATEAPRSNTNQTASVHKGCSRGRHLFGMLCSELCDFRPILTSMMSMMNPGWVICMLLTSISPLIILIAIDILGRSPHFSCTQSKAILTNPTASVSKKSAFSIGSTSFRRLSFLYIFHACKNHCPKHDFSSKSNRPSEQTEHVQWLI